MIPRSVLRKEAFSRPQRRCGFRRIAVSLGCLSDTVPTHAPDRCATRNSTPRGLGDSVPFGFDTRSTRRPGSGTCGDTSAGLASAHSVVEWPPLRDNAAACSTAQHSGSLYERRESRRRLASSVCALGCGCNPSCVIRGILVPLVTRARRFRRHKRLRAPGRGVEYHAGGRCAFIPRRLARALSRCTAGSSPHERYRNHNLTEITA